jgi:glycosyltransferase involved in cell wall biosynthesis
MSTSPQVSVLLPSYERLELLRAAIESVRAQTFTDFELIVADDGSGERTRAWLRTLEQVPNTRVVWLERRGNPAAARNAALRVAHGRTSPSSIPMICGNPASSRARSRRSLPIRAAAGASPVTTTSMRGASPRFPVGVRPFTVHSGGTLEATLRFDLDAATPAVIVDRATLIGIGGFDESLRFYEDYDLWFRLALSPRPTWSVRLGYPCGATTRISALSMRARRSKIGRACWIRCTRSRRRRLRRIARRARALNAARLARLISESGDYGGVIRTLRKSRGYSWPYAGWWLSASIAMARSAVRG